MAEARVELAITRISNHVYNADLRLWLPGSKSARELARDCHITLAYDLLLANEGNTDYARLLTKMVFADSALQTAWTSACDLTIGNHKPLRVCIRLDPSAEELNACAWEQLLDPSYTYPLCLSELVRFSRYVDAHSAVTGPLPSRPELRILFAVASPDDLTKYQLAPVNVQDELARVMPALKAVTAERNITVLARTLTGQPVTFDALSAALLQGFHICYIVCHGKVVDDATYLYLEDGSGKPAPERINELAVKLGRGEQRPLLLMLVACQSAGYAADVVANIGSLLTTAGIPAVIAMRGNTPLPLVERLVPKFFLELAKDGMVDRALTVARGSVSGELPWWLPVLFLRIDDGRIWGDAFDRGTLAVRRLALAFGGLILLGWATFLVARLLLSGIDYVTGGICAALLLVYGLLLSPLLRRRTLARWDRNPGVLGSRRTWLRFGAAAIILVAIQFSLPTLGRWYSDHAAVLPKDERTQALTLLRRATVLDSGDALAHYNLGTLYEDMQRYSEARASYERSIELDPEFVGAYSNLGRLLIIEEQDFAGALSFFTQVEQLRPQEPYTLYIMLKNRGWALLGLKSYGQAERELLSALVLNPKGAAAYCLLAQVYEQQPQPDMTAARSAWRSCLQYEYSGDHVEPSQLERARERVQKGE